MTLRSLKVPGATVHYEVRGAGPLLLLIPGGPEDRSGFAGIVGRLADSYRVVTYDPRGLSASPLDGETADVPVRTFADDAQRLIAALGGEPAYVFGESGGAIVGLDLAARFPDSVRQLVAYEPPCIRLLADPVPHLEAIRDVVETAREHGVGPAMAKFVAAVGFGAGESGEPRQSVADNLGFFLEHMMLETVDRHTPDVSALRSLPVTVAVGADSVGQLAHRTATALAGQLGREAVSFPGNHFGVSTHPEAFAARLRAVLGRS